MQTMSDNEFDKRFRDTFESFEVEPEPLVWANISEQLGKKKRREFPYFWIAAASTAAILIAGLVFMPRKEPIRLYGKVQPAVIHQEKVKVENSETEPSVSLQEAPSEMESVSKKNRKGHTVISAKPNTASYVASNPIVESESNYEVTSIIESSDDIEKADAVTIESPSNLKMRNLIAMNTLPEGIEGGSEEIDHPARRKIKTVADIVNFVVSKVDKRENKIIEFSKEDEGDVVSGLNLGLVQFKTKSK